MTLWKVLVSCENDLGWVPAGKDLIKSRAVMHHIMTKAMAQRRISLGDLQLTLAYCRLKHLPLSSPLQLLPLVATARDAAGAMVRPHALDVRTDMARDWETARNDDESAYWLGRLVRSIGPARADTLSEWEQAGRGGAS